MFLCTKGLLPEAKKSPCLAHFCPARPPYPSFTRSGNSLPDFLSRRSLGFLPEIVPDSLPKSLPDTLPESLPESYPSVLPGFLPKIVPDSLPGSLPGTLPESLPKSYLSVLPGALLKSYPNTYPIRLTQPYLSAYLIMYPALPNRVTFLPGCIPGLSRGLSG
jgi:hypothetical protein